MEGEIPCSFGGCEEPSAWELEYWSPIPSIAYACSEHLAGLIPRQGETRVRPVAMPARSTSHPRG
jgi:hypothetical protein